MFDNFRNTAISMTAGVAILIAGFFGGMVSQEGPSHGPQVSGVPLAPVFDALAWCKKSPAPVITVDPIKSPNGDTTMHAIRGNEEIKFVQTLAYTQSGAIWSHQIIPPGEKESVEVHDTIDFFPDAQRACFGANVVH